MLQRNITALIVSKAEHQKIAVAISGGADSTALLLMIKDCIPAEKIIALTVDHKLRPESTDEAQMVHDFCASLNIEHHILTWTPLSKCTQDTAREARYYLLSEFCKENGIVSLFVGHHQDDLLETFVMRIWKKSNLFGLASIGFLSQKNDIMLIRPLLGTPKAELLSYLRQKKIPYVEDPSNQNTKYLRTIARNFSLTDKEKELFLKFIHLIGQLRHYFESLTLKILQDSTSWETPYVLKINTLGFIHCPDVVREIFVTQVARIMGYTNFFKSNTTRSILWNLSHKLSVTGYQLYWSYAKDFIYVSYEKRAFPSQLYIQQSGLYHFGCYILEIEALHALSIAFYLKFLTFGDCIHLKKSHKINFLFSKTKSPLLSFFFEDLIVFLDEIGYSSEELKKKGWNIKIVGTHMRAVSFVPFLNLPDNGVFRE